MTTQAISKKLEAETMVHETARQMVELLEAAKVKLAAMGMDEDAEAERILEMVTADDE